MDPTATLRLIRELGDDLIQGGCHSPSTTEELIQHMRDLDMWISRGGFLPQDWHKNLNAYDYI